MFGSSYIRFNEYYVDNTGSLNYKELCEVGALTSEKAKSYEYSLRPVFKLKSGIKITGGSGTESDPYTLGT